MADYPTAKAAIASIIDAVTIASPVATGIEQVYAERPQGGEGLMKFPCVLISGAAIEEWSRSAGVRQRTYRVGLRLGVRPTGDNSVSAHAIVEALRNAIGEAFDANVTLNLGGEYSVIGGPTWPAIEPQADGMTVWDDGELLIRISDAVTFAS